MRKLTTDDLDMIVGGTMDDAYELGLEMCKKYGVADEDWEALFEVISDEDHMLMFDALSKKG